MASHPSPKAGHYQSALTSALLRGAWAEDRPAAAPNGTQLDWAELIRKWGKHTGGNTALIHHLRNISLLYLSASPSALTVSASRTAHVPSQSTAGPQTSSGPRDNAVTLAPPAGLQRTATSSSVARPAGTGRTDRAAQFLSPASLDRDDTDAAWTQGRHWWYGVGPESFSEVEEGIRDLEALIKGGTLRPTESVTARCALGYHFLALGRFQEVLSVSASLDDSDGGGPSGEAITLDRVRMLCLRGLSFELLPTPDWTSALKAYTSVPALLQSLLAEPSPAYLGLQSKQIPFDSHREVHRWLGTALSRAAIISARQQDAGAQTLRILRTYHAYAAFWPPTFRPRQRQQLLLLYLRALHAMYPAAGAKADTPYLLHTGTTILSARAAWHKEVSSTIILGQRLLEATTTFPRAGSINQPVTAFTDLCAALCDRDVNLARAVISLMWWSMNLTFQSHSVLRHLTRLLASVGDYDDARRTFELYVRLVEKHRETQQSEVSLQLKRRPTDDVAASAAKIKEQAEDVADVAKPTPLEGERMQQVEEVETDEDEDYVESLLLGARLIGLDLEVADEGWVFLEKAGKVFEDRDRAGRGLNKALRGRFDEARGVLRMAMAVQGSNPQSRAAYQAQSIDHLKSAASLTKSSSAYYHLAYAQAEARSIEAAIEAVRASLEVYEKNVQAWHLLVLLLTAQGDWTDAARAGETGVSIWETEEEVYQQEASDEVDGSGSGLSLGVEAKDFASPHASQTHQPVPASSSQPTSQPLLLPSGTFLPLRSSVTPRPPAALAKARRLERVMSLRMTLNVICEKTQGTESAMLRQQELFAFFSARSGRNRDASGSTIGSRATRSFGSVNGDVEAGGVGGSFVSVDRAGKSEDNGVAPGFAVIPPTPSGENGPAPQPTIPSPPRLVHTAPASPQNSVSSSARSTPEPEAQAVAQPISSTEEKPHRRSLQETRKAIAKHLHVPSPKFAQSSLGKGSRPSSVRRLTNPDSLSPDFAANAGGARRGSPSLLTPNRLASSSSTALSSIAPTAVHSHFHSSHPRIPPPPPPSAAKQETHLRTPAESRILSNLWLASAATFRRWGKYEQCLVAIEEAEVLDPENAEVWVQLGLYHLVIAPASGGSTSPFSPPLDTPMSAHTVSSAPPSSAATGPTAALPCFIKAVLLRPDYPPALVNMSKLYLQTGEVELAHGLLNQLTQDRGWDVPEAWFYLGQVCERQGREKRARECWEFALGLERTRGARRWAEAGWDRL